MAGFCGTGREVWQGFVALVGRCGRAEQLLTIGEGDAALALKRTMPVNRTLGFILHPIPVDPNSQARETQRAKSSMEKARKEFKVRCTSSVLHHSTSDWNPFHDLPAVVFHQTSVENMRFIA